MSALRKAMAAVWIFGWLLALYAVHLPWRALGGIVDERTRWLERFLLYAGAWSGYCLGHYPLRRLLVPVAVATAVTLCALRAAEREAAVGVVAVAFVAYTAGVALSRSGRLAGGDSADAAVTRDPPPETRVRGTQLR